MEKEIKLSVLDIERKYTIDTEETANNDDKMVMWGKNNDAPVLYNNCYRNSATLKSVIDGIVNYVLGDSITVNAGDWVKEVNKRGVTMRQFVASLTYSYMIYGGFAFQVIYNKMGTAKEFYPLDYRKCRVNAARTKVWYNKKGWTKWSRGEEYDAFNPDKFDVENPTQIFWYGGDSLSSIYPFPPYFGALTDVLTEIECSRYSLNSVSNGFSARYIINFPEANNLTDEQKRGIEDAIKNKFSGPESDANFMLYWNDRTGDKLTVEKIENDDAPEKFIAIKDNARTNIFVSMKATPVLFGLPNASNGFSTDEYKNSATLFEKMVVAPIRDVIIESIDKATGIKDSLTITPISISFGNE